MKKKILVVDDSAQIRFLIESFIGTDFELELRNSASDAMQWLLEKERPDLILLDLMMPEVSGFELLEYLQNDPYLKYIPVIVLSGLEKSADRIKALEMGADDFLMKPFHPKELSLRINSVLKRMSYVG